MATNGNPFKVPENYFEEVNRKIISATVEYKTEKKEAGLFIKLRPYLAIASSVTVLAILSYAAIKLFSPKNESLLLATIPLEEYSEIILNDVDLLTLEENAALLSIPETIQQVDKKEIIDYLLFENIDINEIQEQL